MTNEEMRVAIAKECGWRDPDLREPIQVGPDGKLWTALPNYPQDLNKCHEFEEWLNSEYGLRSVNNLSRDYRIELIKILNPGRTLWNNGTFLGTWGDVAKIGHATARQRCEAFLRVKGLWKEEKV